MKTLMQVIVILALLPMATCTFVSCGSCLVGGLTQPVEP